MYEEIASEIRRAAQDQNKIGTFHYQVLINAERLYDVDGSEFCRRVGVPDSYKTEFTKMLRLAKTLREQGKQIVDR